MKAEAVTQHNGWTGFVSRENHYNLLHRADEAEPIPMLLDRSRPASPCLPWLVASPPVLVRERSPRGSDARALSAPSVPREHQTHRC